ncbi:hypothetical protein OF83DRAFT_565723 [Amylostereum chailletii]|nr:hypothetical protein OF83DRAFT_565723 [Amylostereum chailletii]
MHASCRYIYLGLQLEKPQIHLFIGWESVEAHEAAKVAPGNAAASAAAFGPVSVPGSLTFVHTFFVSDPTPALRAPVTEVAWFTLKDGASRARAIALLDVVARPNAAEAARPDRRTFGAAWGEVVERPGRFCLVVGYASVAAHKSYVSSEPAVGKLLKTLVGLMDVEYGHVAFAPAARSPPNRL